MPRFLMVIMSVILMGCAGDTPIKDFSNRSVVYGFLDIGEISGNRLVGISLRMTRNRRGDRRQSRRPCYPQIEAHHRAQNAPTEFPVVGQRIQRAMGR